MSANPTAMPYSTMRRSRCAQSRQVSRPPAVGEHRRHDGPEQQGGGDDAHQVSGHGDGPAQPQGPLRGPVQELLDQLRRQRLRHARHNQPRRRGAQLPRLRLRQQARALDLEPCRVHGQGEEAWCCGGAPREHAKINGGNHPDTCQDESRDKNQICSMHFIIP